MEYEFDKIIGLRKQIQQLKDMEQSIIMGKVMENHLSQKEKLDKKYFQFNNNFKDKKEKETNRFNRTMRISDHVFNKAQKTEKKNFKKQFDLYYPKEDNHNGDINQLKDSINVCIKDHNYEYAQILVNQLRSVKDKKHKDYLKDKRRAYTYAHKHFIGAQNKEKKIRKQDNKDKKWQHDFIQNRAYEDVAKQQNAEYKKLVDAQNREIDNLKDILYSQSLRGGFDVTDCVKHA